MDILIIDDDQYKIEKIKSVLLDFSLIKITYQIAKTVSDGISLLFHHKYDMLILDLNLPIRLNELPQRNAGLIILKELKRNKKLICPTSITGLTQFSDLKKENQNFFEMEGWALIEIISENSDWEDALLNKLHYVYNLKTQKINPMQKILFLSASPKNEDRLRVDEECKKIETGLLKSRDRDDFTFITKFAVDFEGASYFLLNENPQIVHFSGHGALDGIALEDEIGNSRLLTTNSLYRLFELHSASINCIILNACESDALAKELSKLSISVIGMNSSISDDAAIAFSIGFYQGLCGGRDIDFSFKLGLAHVSAAVEKDVNVPTLWRDGNQLN